jgi:hypothetical protein
LSQNRSGAEVTIPSYIHDLDDKLAIWYQATNDGSGWKIEKKERPTVGDYLHSEFRRRITIKSEAMEAQICNILTEYDAKGQTAVCRLDRGGVTLDGWRQRTINSPVTAAPRTRAAARPPATAS